MMLAICLKDIEVVMLTAHGRSPNNVDSAGNSPMRSVILSENIDLLKYLLQFELNPNLCCNEDSHSQYEYSSDLDESIDSDYNTFSSISPPPPTKLQSSSIRNQLSSRNNIHTAGCQEHIVINELEYNDKIEFLFYHSKMITCHYKQTVNSL
ncbi:hypothetical protein GJ496_011466 [Pomphorhynchus laevis]|nr:hypothetical protein GJ496_011466 [Pomphorhynchus laevis]